jgi:thymidylate synthase
MAAEDLAEAVEAADVPCCTTLQFLLRDGRLNLITYMRSNDIFTGFGYDIFFFTMLQELLACELEVALGWYQHVVGSLHLYDQDRRRALAAIESSPDLVVMPPMTNPADLKRVLHYEKEIRRGALLELAPRSDVSEYWQPFLGVLLFHRYRRTAEEGRMREVLTHTRSGWTHPLLELLV